MDRKQAGSVMLLLLYAMLIAALLVLVLLGARLYSQTLNAQKEHSHQRLALSYIQSQVSSFSGDRAVLNAGPEGTMLCLREPDGENETRIYLYENALCSEFAAVDKPVNPAVSQKICDLTAFEIRWQEMGNGLLRIDADGSVGYAYCAGGGGNGK